MGKVFYGKEKKILDEKSETKTPTNKKKEKEIFRRKKKCQQTNFNGWLIILIPTANPHKINGSWDKLSKILGDLCLLANNMPVTTA